MKKRIISLIAMVLAVCAIFCSCSKTPENIDEKLDKVVADVLIEKNSYYSDFGECTAEGHIILGYDKKGSVYNVYTITRTGMYGFENGNFVVVAGSIVKPAVIELTNKLELKKIHFTQEGGMYDSSVMTLFPEEYHERLLNIGFEDENQIDEKMNEYANAYLQSIGREAKVGRSTQFEGQYKGVKEYAVRPSVYNKIFESKTVEDYPFWEGSREAIEDGVRVVYSTDFQVNNSRIVYTKTVYETNEVLELHYFSTDTGEEIK